MYSNVIVVFVEGRIAAWLARVLEHKRVPVVKTMRLASSYIHLPGAKRLRAITHNVIQT
jgi:hypothetical protein